MATEIEPATIEFWSGGPEGLNTSPNPDEDCDCVIQHPGYAARITRFIADADGKRAWIKDSTGGMWSSDKRGRFWPMLVRA